VKNRDLEGKFRNRRLGNSGNRKHKRGRLMKLKYYKKMSSCELKMDVHRREKEKGKSKRRWKVSSFSLLNDDERHPVLTILVSLSRLL
jgi:hypothetical protein